MQHDGFRWTLAALALTLVAFDARAGVVADLATRDLAKPDAPVEINRLYVDGDKVRLDLLVGDQLRRSVIVAGERGLIVDHGQKFYSVVDADTLRILGEQLRLSAAAVDAKLGQLQPEQRELFLNAFRQEAAATRATDLEETAEKGERAGHPSQRYRFARDGATVRDVWATPWSELGTTGADLRRGLQKLSDLYTRMAAPYAALKSGALEGLPIFSAPSHLFVELARIDAFPTAIEVHQGDRKVSETTLQGVASRDLPASDFLPPESYPLKALAQ